MGRKEKIQPDHPIQTENTHLGYAFTPNPTQCLNDIIVL